MEGPSKSCFDAASRIMAGVTYKPAVYYGSVPFHVWQCEGLSAGGARYHQSI